MKVLMINQPMSNRGDESAHRAFVRTLLRKMPEISITVVRVGMNPNTIDQFKVDDSRVEYVNLPRNKGYLKLAKLGLQKGLYFLWNLLPTHRKLRKMILSSDLIISAPGGICLGGFQNWEHLFLLKMVQRLNKKLVYYGRSFGPFKEDTKLDRCFKKHSVETLRYVSFLSVRDKKTEEIANQLGITYCPTVDSAFLETPRGDVPEEMISAIGGRPYIVFVPNLLIWHYAFKGKITKEEILDFYSRVLTATLQKYPGRMVVMLPQTYNQGSKDGNDINFFKDFAQYANNPSIIVAPDTYSSDIQQTIIAGADLMVGARYHSVIFAINNNVPFVALSYEHKIAGILETLGKQEYMVDISTGLFDSKSREECVSVFAKKVAIANRDESCTKNAKKIVQNCFETFLGMIKVQ